jgi:hypothetical protein
MELEAIKNPITKPGVEKVMRKTDESSIDRKAIFKQFINDNYPKYKEGVKKTLSLFLHIERHAAKKPKERIDTYY